MISDDYIDSTATDPLADDSSERQVLGSIVTNGAVLDRVVGILTPDDFHQPRHAALYNVLLTMRAHDVPIDLISAVQQFQAASTGIHWNSIAVDLSQYLGNALPASAVYHAQHVHNAAERRRLAAYAARVQLAATDPSSKSADDLFAHAQALLDDLTDNKNSGSTLIAAGDTLAETMAAIETRKTHGALSAVATGFADLDRLLGGGLHPGQMIVVAARPAVGKALALDTPIPTPTGWTTMYDIQPGDYVLSPDGTPVTVVAVSDVMTDRPCYQVTFSGGCSIVADAEHQWQTSFDVEDEATTGQATTDDRLRTVTEVNTTQDIARTVHAWNGPPNHRVAVSQPLITPIVNLAEDPYALGLRAYQDGIPKEALRGSLEQRRALLDGVLDANQTTRVPDGFIYAAPNSEVASQVRELAHTLGYQAMAPLDDSNPGRRSGYIRKPYRHITQITPLPQSVPVRCIQVANADGLFLAGRDMIPTHNSTLALDIARTASIHNNKTTAFFSLEMSRDDLLVRTVAAETRVLLERLRTGDLTEQDYDRITSKLPAIEAAPLYIDDSAGITMPEIKSRARLLQQRRGLDLIVIDYLQLMKAATRIESRQQEVSELSRGVKLLAKDLEVPVVVLSQLNRGSENRSDPTPQISDLRESGCLTAGTRIARADGGATVTLGELFQQGSTNIPVWSLNEETQSYQVSMMTHVFATGHRDVFDVVTRTGRRVTATSNHPLLTSNGWTQVGDLRIGQPVAVPSDGDGITQATTVVWDDVASIDRAGKQDVYDATVLETHNFIANGITVHNSIEQDADVVMLLHREDLKNPDSPRVGEVDVIVAKQRQGATGIVALSALLHVGRMASMPRD